jgi:metal transporter CNNM
MFKTCGPAAVCIALLAILSLAHAEVAGADWRLKEVVQTLEATGITGLCHPFSDEFSPLFPLCDVTTSPEQEQEHHLDYDYQRFLLSAQAAAEAEEPKDMESMIRNGIMAFICVCTAALAAGLTLGLLSLDPINLLIKMRTASTEEEKQQAASLLPIVRQHHLLLVTLLLLNSMSNEALPLFLDKLVPGYVAIILSVTLVLFFGEIIPSAIFTGPDRIKIASKLAPMVRLIMCLLYPIAFPIAKMLDILLHDDDEDNTAFTRSELSALVRIQYEERMANKKRRKQERMAAGMHHSMDMDESQSMRMHDFSASAHSLRILKRQITPMSTPEAAASPAAGLTTSIMTTTTSIKRPPTELGASLHFDEVNMMVGALNMKTKMAMDIYTPLRRVFAVPYDTILTEPRIVEIYSSGFSRIPIYKNKPGKEKDKTGVVGIMLTKQLIVVNNVDKRAVSTLPLQIPNCVSPTMNLVDLINLFQTPSKGRKGGHMAIVCARPAVGQEALAKGAAIPEKAGMMGVVTLEDCLEELLQEEIYDETDRSEIQRMRMTKWAWRKWKLFVNKRRLKREELSIDQMHDGTLLAAVVTEATTALRAAEQGEATPLIANSSATDGQEGKFEKKFLGLF